MCGEIVENLSADLLEENLCASRSVWLSAVMQENRANFSAFVSFVFDRAPKLLQRFMVNLWCYCAPWSHEFRQHNSLADPEHYRYYFSLRKYLFEFYWPVWVCIHCFHCFLFSLRLRTESMSRLQPRFWGGHSFPFFQPGQKERLWTLNVSLLFLHPQCTELTVAKSKSKDLNL